MAVPIQLTTSVQNETFGGVTYHIEGELVPALHLELSNTGVYFEHHILLWKDPAVIIALHPMKGAFKRMLAGMPFMLTGAPGPGRIAFIARYTGDGSWRQRPSPDAGGNCQFLTLIFSRSSANNT